MKRIPFLKDGCVFKQIDDTAKGTEFKDAKIPLIEDGCIVGYTTLEEAEAEVVEKEVVKEVVKKVTTIPFYFFKGKFTKNTWASIFSIGYNKGSISAKAANTTQLEVKISTSESSGLIFYATCNSTKDCYFVGNAWKCGTATTSITGENNYITFAICNVPLYIAETDMNTDITANKWFGIETDVVIGGTRYAGDGFIRISLTPNSDINGYEGGEIRFCIKTTCEGIKKNEVNLKGKKVEFYLPNNERSYKLFDIPVSYS